MAESVRMQERRVDTLYVLERGPTPPRASSPTRKALLATGLGLVAVSAAAVFTFTRIFDSLAFLWPVTATALVAHALAAVLRRRRWRFSGAFPISVLGVALTSAASSLRPSIRADLVEAWSTFNSERAPVPPTRAFVFGASLLIGLVVIVADALAFRRRALFGALVPGLFVFGLTAMFGDHRHRLASIVVLVASCVWFALAHRLAFFDRGSGWMIERTLPHGRMLTSGLAVACIAVLVALAVGPSLPGATNQPLVAWRDIGNGWAPQEDGVALAPLVSVRAQLIDQSDTEVFTVQADQPDYWRLTALDTFDGTEWSASSSSAAMVLPTQASDAAQRQVVTIKALRGYWLPSAFGPVAVQLDDNSVVFDPDSATLVSDDRLGKGDSYVVWSSSTDADVSAATTDDLSVPRAVRQQLTSLANRIVRDVGAVTAIDKARALEAYFLTNFTYDLNVAAGSSITDITSFLQRRAGYCEQFAATFAAMARVLGIPSRVAIGYRIGTFDPAENVYSVTGENAHAWPELYIGGRWVRFEPTPATAEESSDAADVAADAAAADTAPPASSPEAAPATTAPTEAAPAETAEQSPVDSTASTDHGAGVGRLALIAGLVVAALSLPVIVDRVRRERGRRRARHDLRAQVAWTWNDGLRWLRIAGVDAHSHDTPLEVATRAGPVVQDASSELVALARLVTAACYDKDGPAAGDVVAAREGVETIAECAKAHVGRMWRVRYYVAQVKGVAVHAESTSSSVAQPSSIS